MDSALLWEVTALRRRRRRKRYMYILTIQVHNSNEDFHVGMEIQIFYIGRSSKKLFESYHLFFLLLILYCK